jgi:hypothetical protein
MLSVIALYLRYVFALSHNSLTLLRSIITSNIYCSGHIGAIIASYSYCSKLIDQRYCFYLLSLFRYYPPAYHLTNSLSKEIEGDKQNFLRTLYVTCTRKRKFNFFISSTLEEHYKSSSPTITML